MRGSPPTGSSAPTQARRPGPTRREGPSRLFWPTMPDAPEAPPDPVTLADPIEPVGAAMDAPEAVKDQGRGETAAVAEPRTPRPRRKRLPAGGETRRRKLSLPDGVYDRPQLLAIQRRSTASAVAVEILDRNRPRLRIGRDG
jgi:hypothetical protein